MDQGKDSAIVVKQLLVLLVGHHEPDFLRLRLRLDETCHGRVLLKHALSIGKALSGLAEAHYDLVLCDEPRDDSTRTFWSKLNHQGIAVPVLFLREPIDEEVIHGAVASFCQRSGGGDESSISRALLGTITDYCKENQQQRTEDTLRTLWHAVEQTADLVVITDHFGVIEYVNRAFAALTGYSREEALGQSFRMLKSSQQALELYPQIWQTLVAGNSFRGVILNQKKNGDTFLAEKTITPVRNSAGEIIHFISTDRDITERNRLEAQLQQAQRMDAIGRLAGGVAHDFNNLLMVISSYAELMLDSIAGQHPLRHNIEEIMAASSRAADLTRQLLAFGRQQMQSLRVLDLNPVIQEIGRMLPHLIGEDIQLVVVQGNKLGKVKADLVQIEQILMNLAANARDAMPRGGKLVIETANLRLDDVYLQRHPMVPAGDYVQLTVTDTGNGIAPKHLAHIFEPFYTTKEEGKGTGLGLATVYGIVKQSGGFIWVYSEPGLGTTFKIYLPRVRQKSDKPYSAKPAQKPPRGWETLLLAEDEAAVRQSEKEFLDASGYTVLEAGNGDDALRVARNYAGPIHLMVTDVVMPRVDGAKLAEQLSAERPEMKVLFVSGYAESTVLQRGAIDMAGQFLQKPFTLKSLAHKIREVLAKGETARAAASAG